MKKNKELYVDGSAFINKNSKNKLAFKILKIVALTVVIVLFIAGSIWDRKIAKAMGDLNDNGFGSWLCLFWDKLAYTMALPLIFSAAGIFLETINQRYKAKLKYFYIVIILVYVFFIILFTLYVTRTIYQQATFFAFGGKGRDYWFGLGEASTISAMTIQMAAEDVVMCVTAWFLRVKLAKNDALLANNYWIDAVKMCVVFAFFGVIFDPIMKAFWGRPYWVHVDYQYVIDHLPANWTHPQVVNAPYLDWWQVQAFHSSYWDFLLGKSGEGNNFWSDKAFPSGHMNASSLPVYGFLLYFMNEKRGRKISWWKWLLFGLFVADVIMMALMEMMSRTHYLTDLMFSLFIIMTFFKSVTYAVDHVIYKILSFIWNKQNKSYDMFEWNNGKKIILFIKINGVFWIVAKVKSSKIDKSKKYKYWHKRNVSYVDYHQQEKLYLCR